MARGLKLKRFKIKQANHWHLKVWRIRVEVDEVSGGMDPNIFLWTRNDPDPDTEEVIDEFMTVATVADMSRYPEADPNPEADNPYYRTDFFEIDVEAQQTYDEVWQIIRLAAEELVLALDRAEQLIVAETAWLGESPPESE